MPPKVYKSAERIIDSVSDADSDAATGKKQDGPREEKKSSKKRESATKMLTATSTSPGIAKEKNAKTSRDDGVDNEKKTATTPAASKRKSVSFRDDIATPKPAKRSKPDTPMTTGRATDSAQESSKPSKSSTPKSAGKSIGNSASAPVARGQITSKIATESEGHGTSEAESESVSKGESAGESESEPEDLTAKHATSKARDSQWESRYGRAPEQRPEDPPELEDGTTKTREATKSGEEKNEESSGDEHSDSPSVCDEAGYQNMQDAANDARDDSSDGSSSDSETGSNGPPLGYDPLKAEDLELSKQERKMFSKKHLAGKEVYIFDIPEHIPFYNIKRLRLQDIKKGKIVVKHKKKEYSFVDEGVVTDPVFGVQRYADNERSFGLLKLPVTRKVSLVEHATNPRKTMQSFKRVKKVVKQKVVHQQPMGLKKRHFAAGFNDDDDSNHDYY